MAYRDQNGNQVDLSEDSEAGEAGYDLFEEQKADAEKNKKAQRDEDERDKERKKQLKQREAAAEADRKEQEELKAANALIQAELELRLLEQYPPKSDQPKAADLKPRFDRFVALNPAQQPMINFLQKRDHGDPRPSWLAQLCIPPLGVKLQEPEPDEYVVIGVADIRPTVLSWSNTDEEYLPLIVEDKLKLTFKRCIQSDALVDLDVPFRTLNTALVKDVTQFQKAQTQFAEFGIALSAARVWN